MINNCVSNHKYFYLEDAEIKTSNEYRRNSKCIKLSKEIDSTTFYPDKSCAYNIGLEIKDSGKSIFNG